MDIIGEPVTADGTVVGTAAALRAVNSEQVQRRLHQLDALLLHSPEAVTVCDRDGQIVEWSAAAERMFGWTRAQMLTSDSLRLVPPEDHEQFRATWAAVAGGEDVTPYEAVRLDRYGARRTVNVHLGAVREQGRFAGVGATFRDLSERQLRDRQLAELLDRVSLAAAAYDLDGEVTFAAGGGFRAAGIDPDAAYGVSLLSTSPAGTAVHDAVQDSLRGRTRDFQVLFDDRQWRCHTAPVLESGLLTGGFVVGLDVTEQQQSEDRLANALAAAPLALVCCDADGVITYAAGSAYSASGVEPASTVGASMLEMYGDSVDVADAIGQCLNGRNVDIATGHGGRIWDLHYRSHLTANGQPNGWVAMAQDVTGWLATIPQQREPVYPSPIPELTTVAVATAQVPEPLVGFLERDELTGLLGWRGLQRALGALSSADAESPFAVALADVDAFSLVNETYGYDVGDEVLRHGMHLLGGLVYGRPA